MVKSSPDKSTQIRLQVRLYILDPTSHFLGIILILQIWFRAIIMHLLLLIFQGKRFYVCVSLVRMKTTKLSYLNLIITFVRFYAHRTTSVNHPATLYTLYIYILCIFTSCLYKHCQFKDNCYRYTMYEG